MYCSWVGFEAALKPLFLWAVMCYISNDECLPLWVYSCAELWLPRIQGTCSNFCQPEHMANSTLSFSSLNEFLKTTTYSCFGNSWKVLLERIPLQSLLLSVHYTTSPEVYYFNSFLWCLTSVIFMARCDPSWKKQQFLFLFEKKQQFLFVRNIVIECFHLECGEPLSPWALLSECGG